MTQNTVNQRIEKLVEHFCRGNKSAFAKAVGITSQSLGEIIGGRQSAPSFAALQKIALAYPSVSLHWLVLGEEPMWEITDRDPAYELEQYADQAEDTVAELVKSGKMSASHLAPSSDSLWQLRESEEAARVALTSAIDHQRKLLSAQYHRFKAGVKDSADEAKALAQADAKRDECGAQYVDAVRLRMRAERELLGFNTSSVTAIYKLGEQEDATSLYGGLLANRLGITHQGAEKLVKSGKIRATYIDGEGYRITEQAVRIFLGEF